MPRKIIPLITGEKYHVYNRGVDKRVVFESKADYLRFYMSLDVFNTIDPSHNFEAAKNRDRKTCAKLVQIHAYSLLPNHFHLIIEQLCENGVSEFMKRVSGGYTSYFNDRHGRSGVLFQGVFKRIHIDKDEYFNYLFAYVNENHFVHKLKRDDDIFYSSSKHYSKFLKSKLLPELEESFVYDTKESIKLALDIADKREIIETEV